MKPDQVRAADLSASKPLPRPLLTGVNLLARGGLVFADSLAQKRVVCFRLTRESGLARDR
jgi:hypothetical protein